MSEGRMGPVERDGRDGRDEPGRGEGLAAQVLDAARRSNSTIGCAESCTGGLIAAALTEVPGSSDVFVGGIVSYWPRIKEGLLGVDPCIIEQCGVVSRECAEAMAQGALAALGVDYAVATTGVAGPGGGDEKTPVGTVWIACAGPDQTSSRIIHAPGNRSQVRKRAVTCALELLLCCIA